MIEVQGASYARVSSEHAPEANALASQVAALLARADADGVAVPPERRFVDDGYSGATLVRPALERLRDPAALGGLDRLYVHAPDRLARSDVHRVLLLEELGRAGVAVVFLDRAIGDTPEDALLLQIQGVVAEYERAKIMERSRRGKRYAAQTGAVSVLAGAPDGDRYVRKAEGGGVARDDVALEEARVVRQVFAWVGEERLTLAEVSRRLRRAGVRSPSGQGVWDRTTIGTCCGTPPTPAPPPSARRATAPGSRSNVFTAATKDRRDQTVVLHLASARTPIYRHVIVKGANSPMDPALREYWAKRAIARGRTAYADDSWTRAVGDRTSWVCTGCKRPLLNGEPIDAHHLTAVAAGGTNRPGNHRYLFRIGDRAARRAVAVGLAGRPCPKHADRLAARGVA